MKLTYRGVSYEYTPPQVETSNSNTVGKYRGLDVRFRNPVKTPVLQSNLDLLYRGVAYHVGSSATEASAPVVASEATPANATTVNTPAPQPVLSMENKARAMMLNHHRSIKRRQQNMLTRLDAEVGLTAHEAARYWNHIQGKVHPSFWATYDRSHAALS